MKHLVAAAALVAGAAVPAAADEPMGKIRDLYAKGDYEGVRRELLAQYEQSPEPALLFALGQVELNLGNFAVAIDYYERFLATNPDAEQAALAQQAIGAARMKLNAPPPPPDPPPPPRYPPREWRRSDTGFVAFGGAAIVIGAGLLVYSHRLGNDQSGTLADYDDRLALARTTRWTGAGVAAAGALVVGVTVLRWRLRPDGGELTAHVTPGSIGVSARW